MSAGQIGSAAGQRCQRRASVSRRDLSAASTSSRTVFARHRALTVGARSALPALNSRAHAVSVVRTSVRHPRSPVLGPESGTFRAHGEVLCRSGRHPAPMRTISAADGIHRGELCHARRGKDSSVRKGTEEGAHPGRPSRTFHGPAVDRRDAAVAIVPVLATVAFSASLQSAEKTGAGRSRSGPNRVPCRAAGRPDLSVDRERAAREGRP